jgi:putative SOS response-associated peptidase YedK
MMCGRFTLAVDAATQIQHRSRQQVTVITGRARRGDLFWAYWGLLPAWAKDRSLGFKLINARSETAESRPSFRDAYRQRRCLIPADGFFEWKSVDDGKQPIHITLPGRRPFAFAGLWERWHSPEGQDVLSCCLLTSAANRFMQGIHNRMPVILDGEGAPDCIISADG